MPLQRFHTPYRLNVLPSPLSSSNHKSIVHKPTLSVLHDETSISAIQMSYIPTRVSSLACTNTRYTSNNDTSKIK
jgi:hypothetical protein